MGTKPDRQDWVSTARRACYALVALYLAVAACSKAPVANRGPVTLRFGGGMIANGRMLGLDTIVENLTAEALVSIAVDGRASRRLARSWEWSSDRRTLDLTLEPNVQFHDGTIADNVRLASSLRKGLLGNPENGVTAVEAGPPGHILVRLSRPNAFLLSDLAEENLTDPKNPRNGTGPFRVVQTKPYPVLAASPNYYRGQPSVDRVELKAYPTMRNAWAATMRGEVDVLYDVTTEALPFVQAESTVRTYSFTRPYYYALVFNLRNKMLGRREVRQALSQSVNRQRILESAMFAQGRVADGPIWPDHWAYSRGQRTYTYDPDAAGVRLDTAGFEWRRERQPDRMPARMHFNCLTLRGNQTLEHIAMYVQKDLAQIGVDMSVEAVPARDLVSRMQQGNFDALLLEFVSGRGFAWTYTFWHSGSPYVNNGYRSADDVLDRLRAATSDDSTRAALGDLQRTLYDDPPAIFLAWPESTRAVSAAFEVPAGVNGDVIGSLWRWRLAPPSVEARR